MQFTGSTYRGHFNGQTKKYQDESHKNVTREQFFRSFSPEAARQLRRALDTSKKTQEKPHE